MYNKIILKLKTLNAITTNLTIKFKTLTNTFQCIPKLNTTTKILRLNVKDIHYKRKLQIGPLHLI